MIKPLLPLFASLTLGVGSTAPRRPPCTLRSPCSFVLTFRRSGAKPWTPFRSISGIAATRAASTVT